MKKGAVLVRLSIVIICILLTLSCQKTPPNGRAIIAVRPVEVETSTSQKVDTFKLENFADTDRIQVRHLEKNISKAGGSTAKFHIEFLRNGSVVSSVPVQNPFNEGEEGSWYLNSEIMRDSKKVDKRFICLTYGYEACGYLQSSYLFFIKGRDVQFVTRWATVPDAGYGSYIDIFPVFVNDTIESFATR
ncbi:MAG TPA: hypothetical protein VGB43_04740, partial [Flavobacterium sp.]